MVERICLQCGHGNPLDHHFCGKCGSALERLLPAPLSQQPLARLGASIPARWRDIGRAVAISAVALAAEAGIAWLARRIEQRNLPVTPLSAPMRTVKPAAQPLATRTATNVVTIISERVIEFIDEGNGMRRMSERAFWRRVEE
ncbi:MAG: zinc ribbon domain-containing protein [Roseiflexus sp.]|nr:zinc ribbon domain-containing protein [Roseiflexus sp.]MCS7289112.1 zinc ribbon domain-containing protein [Roseiflexus sp.]MDW8144716.1 zinc ribbon domain-containing protein [Roseiflexaceae bacterium]MDW8233270.1 zinc ribbon domain-containing protein [Roseiflexaceae bacterium]